MEFNIVEHFLPCPHSYIWIKSNKKKTTPKANSTHARGLNVKYLQIKVLYCLSSWYIKKSHKKEQKEKKTKKEKKKEEVGLFGHQYGRLICGHYGQIIGGHRYIWPIDRLLHCTEGLYICFV